MTHAYDIKLGLSGQLRQAVEPARLRLALHPDEAIEVYDGTTWRAGKYSRGTTMRRKFQEGDRVECYYERQWEDASVVNTNQEETLQVTLTAGPHTGQEVTQFRGLCRLKAAPRLSISRTVGLGNMAILSMRSTIMDREVWKRYASGPEQDQRTSVQEINVEVLPTPPKTPPNEPEGLPSSLNLPLEERKDPDDGVKAWGFDSEKAEQRV